MDRLKVPGVIAEAHTFLGEGIVMRRYVNVLLVLTGAAMLLGCQIDPPGKAPGGLEPSPSSQQSDERSGTARDSGSDEGGSDGGG
jgi:hypothetical protein